MLGLLLPLWLLGEYARYHIEEYTFSVIWLIVALLAGWPLLAIQVKRWHDRSKSGFWVFINMVPIIGTIWPLIELGYLQGSIGPNKYGNDPLSACQRESDHP